MSGSPLSTALLGSACAIGLALTALPARVEARSAETPVVVTAYRSASCGCCKGWLEHLRQAGLQVKDQVVTDVGVLKRRYGVPAALASCHTARVGEYTVEGHIPASVIRKLFRERPDVSGIAVPGMPLGSPGMEAGNRRENYTVFSFTRSGTVAPFHSIRT